MKRLLLVFGFVLALSTLGAGSVAAGGIWPLHRHHKEPAAAKPPKAEKTKKSWLHHEKSGDKARQKSAQQEASLGISPGPKSVGGRHPSPGPAGAGAN